MKCLLSIVFSLCLNSIFSQISPGFSVGVGRFIKHTPKLTFESPGLYYFAELNMHKRGSDSLSWNRYWSIANIQHSLSFISFGDPEVLGYSVAYVPGIHFSLWKGKIQSIEFGLNSGFSWHSKVYDKFDNPLNNAISSRINSTSRFTFHWKRKIHKYGILSNGIFFHHYSNAALETPNLGYNAFGVFCSVQFMQQSNRPPVNYIYDPYEQLNSRWKYYVYIHYGAKESGAASNGPLFKMGAVGMGMMYHLKNYIRILGGLEYEWDGAQFAFYKSNLTTYSSKEAIKLANSWMISGGIELLFGPIGLRFAPGIYLKFNTIRSYNRVGIYYYFNVPDTRGILALGINLKNHKFVAHYGALTISYQF